MIRSRLWFRCAAVGDAVAPIQVEPVRISWEAKQRQVDLVIERDLKGEELLRRMKGWITVDPEAVIEAVRPHGRLKLLDERILVVECEDMDRHEALSQSLNALFPEKVDLEPMNPIP